MSQFDITTYPSQVFWLMVLFGIMYFIIAKVVAPMATKIAKHRQEVFSQYIKDAETIAQKVKTLDEHYDESFKKILLTTEEIKHTATAKLDQLFSDKQAVLNDELNTSAKRYETQVRDVIAKFDDNKRNISIELAGFVIEKIMQQPAERAILDKSYDRVIS